MPNELPRQLYIARITLKCGAVFDVITPLTEEELHELCYVKGAPFTIPGVNPQKQWPVNCRVYDEVMFFIHSPHEVWLKDRPNLSIS